MICLNCGGIITLTRSEGRKLALYITDILDGDIFFEIFAIGRGE